MLENSSYNFGRLLQSASSGPSFPLHFLTTESKPFSPYWLKVIPCAVLALFIHPSTSHHFINRIFWAFCVYLEAVSVLPQLRVMQNTKVNIRIVFHHSFICTFLSEHSLIVLLLTSLAFITRLLNHLLHTMCLHWVWQDFWPVHIGSFRFIFPLPKNHALAYFIENLP